MPIWEFKRQYYVQILEGLESCGIIWGFQFFSEPKSFWPKNLLVPKIFLDPIFFSPKNSFWTHNYFGPNFLFGTKHFYPTQSFFWPKISHDPESFQTKIFLAKIFSDPKYFWSQNFLDPIFFWTFDIWTPKLFGPQTLLIPKFFK